MKKRYVKPTFDVLNLRPEERLAACDYPIGFWFSQGDCNYAWVNYAGYESVCEEKASTSFS